MTDDVKYEYLVKYKDRKPGLFVTQKGRTIKQTLEGAKTAAIWARSRYRDVHIMRRQVSDWQEVNVS